MFGFHPVAWLEYHSMVFFTVDIPWWLYIVLGFILAFLVLGFLGSRLAALAVLCVGLWLGAASWGSARMHAADLLEFQREAAAEQERLREAFKQGAEAEATRAGVAQHNQSELNREAASVEADAAKLPDAWGVDPGPAPPGHPRRLPIVIPESVARGVCQLPYHPREPGGPPRCP